MRILFTGASSFTGYWFVRTLAEAGHQVTACFRGDRASYAGVRKMRINRLGSDIDAIWSLEVGDQKFLDLVASGDYDLFCHHAAEMSDYRSWSFDPLDATAKNTRSARTILRSLADRGCRRVIMTGSVFEPYEGQGDAGGRAFNPYGLSKHLTFELYRMEAELAGISIDKFVIPNPFGAYEEPRFTSYLVKEWKEGRVPGCRTPDYVRDNIPVDLLALSYRNFCEQKIFSQIVRRASPSGYVETQGAFANRVAAQFGHRFGKSVEVKLERQTIFSEPLVRINNEPQMLALDIWSEERFWDAAVDFWLTESQ